jgi:CRP-like cAMP-binding protein
VLADAQALGEVTAVQIGREHIEGVLQAKPLLLQELGRLIEERRSHVKEAMAEVAE